MRRRPQEQHQREQQRQRARARDRRRPRRPAPRSCRPGRRRRCSARCDASATRCRPPRRRKRRGTCTAPPSAFNASQAAATAPASIAAISNSQAGWCGSAPVTKARRRVRAISRSVSCSAYWLKAPALAEATSTDSASTSTWPRLSAAPGVTARPTSAVTMISVPMRSLNSESTSRATAMRAAGSSQGRRVHGVALVQLRPHSCPRYFQLMK